MEEIRFDKLAERLRRAHSWNGTPDEKEREITGVCAAAARLYSLCVRAKFPRFEPLLGGLEPCAWPRVEDALWMLQWGSIAMHLAQTNPALPGGREVGDGQTTVFDPPDAPVIRRHIRHAVGTGRRIEDYAAVMDRLHEMVKAAEPSPVRPFQQVRARREWS